MFERFSDRSRKVVSLAQDEARALKCNYIGTEHVLLGLLREERGLAALALTNLGITVEKFRAAVIRVLDIDQDDVVVGDISFTPRAKKVLELSIREALVLGHNHVGTEHILLGMVRENDGVATRILLDLDADPEKIRGEVLSLLPLAHPWNGAEEHPVLRLGISVMTDAELFRFSGFVRAELKRRSEEK